MNRQKLKLDKLEIELMELEVRLDRIQNESRKALGMTRKILGYHRKERQKTLRHYGFGERFRHSVRDGAERVEKNQEEAEKGEG